MTKEVKELKVKMLYNLVKGLAPLLPNWIEICDRIVEMIKHNSCSRQYDVRQTLQNLQSVRKKYGREALVDTLQFIVKTGLAPVDQYLLDCVGKACSEKKHDLLDRTFPFYQSYPKMFWYHNFINLFYGIEKFGEQEIAAGIALAPKPKKGEDKRYNRCVYSLAQEWRDRRQSYALLAAAIGFKRAREIRLLLLQEGFDENGILDLIEEIPPTPYCRLSAEERESMVRLAVAIVKEIGLSAKDYAKMVRNKLFERRGTVKEIKDILRLAKECDVTPHFVWWVFDRALECWWQPLDRHAVIEAFQTHDYNLLTFYQSRGSGFGFAYYLGDEATKEEIRRILAIDLRIRLAAITLAILQGRHAELGFNLHQRLAIASLALNPLFTGEMIHRPDQTGWAREIAAKAFGEAFKLVCQLGKTPKQKERYALAAIRAGSPEQLIRLLSSLPRQSWPKIAKAIIDYDFDRVAQALGRLSPGQDPAIYLPLSIARVISEQGNRLEERSGWEYRLIFASDDHLKQLTIFMQLPRELRLVLARSVRLYRRIYEKARRRIETRRV